MTDKTKTDGGPTDPAVPETVSILPLRDLVVFPHAVVPLAAGRESSLRLIEDAVRAGRPIGTFGQLDATFGTGGLVTTNATRPSSARASSSRGCIRRS